jgi:hypothetical protein
MIPTIRVITNPNNVDYGKVFINDFEVPGLRGVQVNVHINELSTVNLEIAGRIETETFKKDSVDITAHSEEFPKPLPTSKTIPTK